MPNYGLVTDIKKYGIGSLRTPFDTSQAKALRIDPQGATTFWMSAGQDFYLSAWIRYGTVNVATLGAKYPIIRYGGASTDFGAPFGWEIGIRTINIGGNTAVPYFAYNNQIINTTFDGTNGNQISPSSTAFDHYEVYRSNNVITFKFTNSSNIANITTANYSLNIGQLAADYYTNAIFVGSQQPFVVNQDNGAYIDELFFAKGTSQVINYNQDSTIADGTEPTTIFLLHFDNSLEDTTTGLKNYSAQLASSFASQQTAKKTVSAIASITSSSNSTVSATKVKQFNAVLTTTTQILAGVNVSKSTLITISSNFTQVATVLATRIVNSALDAQITVSTAANRIRGASIALQAFNTQLTIGKKAVQAQAVLTSRSSLTCSAVRSVTQQGAAAIIARSTITATAGVVRGTAQANLSTRVLWSYIYDKTQPLTLEGDIWVIPADERIYVIPASLAVWRIELDERTYIIEQQY